MESMFKAGESLGDTTLATNSGQHIPAHVGANQELSIRGNWRLALLCDALQESSKMGSWIRTFSDPGTAQPSSAHGSCLLCNSPLTMLVTMDGGTNSGLRLLVASVIKLEMRVVSVGFRAIRAALISS